MTERAKKKYGSFEEAEERVQSLRNAFGIWPGIRTNADGTFTLLYDPGTTSKAFREMSLGRES